jgi:hypothetical protein
MSGQMVFVLGVAIVLAVAAIGVSLFAVWRSQALVHVAGERARAGLEHCEATTESLQKAVDGLAAQLLYLPRQPSADAIPVVPRPGLNLSKRSQVLRMHRKGDPLDRIAAALEVPLHEVDLLIKVHHIVIKNL